MGFLRKLPAEYKLLWLYMWDDCDHAGIWHIDLDTAFTRLGIKFSLEKIRGLFAEKVVEFESGTKLFIPDFIAFQYGELKQANKVHRSVFKSLESYGIKGYGSPLEGAMNKDKDFGINKIQLIQGTAIRMKGDYQLQDMALRVRGFSESQFHFAVDDFLSDELNYLGKEQGEVHSHFAKWCRTKEEYIKSKKGIPQLKKEVTDADQY
jgi:hypothetical protein